MTFRLPAGVSTRVLAWAVLCALSLVIILAAKSGAERSGIEQLQTEGERKLDIYLQALSGELGRFDYLPTVVALNENIIKMLLQPDDQNLRTWANDYLQRVNANARSSAVYVLDRNGVTLAASNWNEEITFVGANLEFRPYFQEALKAVHGRFQGIGTMSGIPGYFWSSPIIHNDTVIGVLALKVSLENFELIWRSRNATSREIAAVVDRNGIILLSSWPSWRYKIFNSLDPKALQQIRASRQYDGASLKPIELDVVGSNGTARVVNLSSQMPDQSPGSPRGQFLEQVRTVDTAGWHLFLFSDLQPTKRFALSVTAISGLMIAVATMLVLYLHQRQRAFAQTAAAKEALQAAHDRLERDITERTADLVQANEQLHREIVERSRAADVLREAQAGLVHAEKLAALGQMSAGITPELNQPLTALQTLSDNARVLLERNRIPEATANLSTISELAKRMGHVVAHWKQIARKSHPSANTVSIRTVISNALMITGQQIKSKKINLIKDTDFEDISVKCDPNRLEQILINLLSNAIDAVTQASCPEIYIDVFREKDRAVICVRDNGAGIPEEVMPRLFEPFFTTKEAGSGLGLGLAISSELAREMNGTLTARNQSEGGAEFILDLPIASPEGRHA